MHNETRINGGPLNFISIEYKISIIDNSVIQGKLLLLKFREYISREWIQAKKRILTSLNIKMTNLQSREKETSIIRFYFFFCSFVFVLEFTILIFLFRSFIRPFPSPRDFDGVHVQDPWSRLAPCFPPTLDDFRLDKTILAHPLPIE